MYAEGQILVRDEYLDRVRAKLDEKHTVLPRERVIGDISLLRFTPKNAGRRAAKPPAERLDWLEDNKIRPPIVPDALEEIDREFGEGVATPNHVLTVAGEIGPCPATEPEMVDDQIEPSPGVCWGNSGAGVSIYVADTGLLKQAAVHHPWLSGVRGDDDPLQPAAGVILPYAGHGTFVAGVARCMAPQADVYVSNVFKVAGSQLESRFVKHLREALTKGYDIFHLAITAPTRNDLPLQAFEAWLKLVRQYQGVVCVAAAGNNGSPMPCWPAAFPEVVSVGALAANWRDRANFSNYGGWVDVYAPGRNLVNAYATGTYTCQIEPYTGQVRRFTGMARWSGTSFSTPIVTGLIAARMSCAGESGQQAAAALLAEARCQAIPGVGAVLLPCDGKGGVRGPCPAECCCAHPGSAGCCCTHQHRPGCCC